MLGYLFHFVFNWLNIERWNNYPRIERIVETEHIALLLHYITILYFLKENKSNIDLYKIFVYLIWTSFFTFIYSDINSYVKNKITEKSPKIFDELNNLIKTFLLSLELPKSIKKDIDDAFSKNFLNQEEINLVKFAKLLTVKKEIEVNSKIYYNVYSDSVKDINSLLNKFTLSFRPEKIKLIDDYINQVKRLKFSYRWNRLKRKYQISVLSHLFIVFFISYIIWKLKKFEKETVLEMMFRWLFHDIPEALTGDIVSPTKKAVKWLEDLIWQIEEELVYEKLLKNFDISIKEKFTNRMLRPFEWKIWKLVKYADIFCALLETKIETTKIFQDLYIKIKRNLLFVNDSSIQYLLKFWDEYFLDNVESVWLEFIKER